MLANLEYLFFLDECGINNKYEASNGYLCPTLLLDADMPNRTHSPVPTRIQSNFSCGVRSSKMEI